MWQLEPIDLARVRSSRGLHLSVRHYLPIVCHRLESAPARLSCSSVGIPMSTLPWIYLVTYTVQQCQALASMTRQRSWIRMSFKRQIERDGSNSGSIWSRSSTTFMRKPDILFANMVTFQNDLHAGDRLIPCSRRCNHGWRREMKTNI